MPLLCIPLYGLNEVRTLICVSSCHFFTMLLKACKLKLGDAKGALLDTEFATRNGEDNAKALFRQGQVHMLVSI